LPHRRVVSLPGDGLGIARALAEQLLPDSSVESHEASGWPREASVDTPEASCGLLEHEHTYGGSVPEGTRVVRWVVLVDALIEAEAYDSGTETYLSIWASTPQRADALEALVRARL
jgi:Rod binding domain-containing protein